MHTNVRKSFITAALGCLLSLAPAAEAGPPAICHAVEVGASLALPWGQGHGWNSPDPDYDTSRLREDTLALLVPAAPILARMENIRRATIYAGKDPEVAADLLRAVFERIDSAAAPDARDPLAWFDAGYLLATFRQWHLVGEFGMDAVAQDWLRVALGELGARDGYALILAAIEANGGNPEMEYAASLVAQDHTAILAHWQRAAAGAPNGSLLALNLDR